MERPRLVRDWVGNYVESTRQIRNGLGELPAGTIYKVTSSSGKTVHFASVPCKCCGFKFHFTVQGRNKFADMIFLGKEPATLCSTCKERSGKPRVDNISAAGVHCDKCWEDMLYECRKRSW